MPADSRATSRVRQGFGWLVPLAVAAASLIAFAPALEASFVNWDDEELFVRNLEYRGLTPKHLWWMLTNTTLGHWAPLTWITHGLDYALWGMNAKGYHLSNLIFHAATVLAFLYVALRLLRLAMPGRDDAALRFGAVVATLFFAIHPLRVESVAWITERRDVVSGLFLVLTVLAYLKAAADDPPGRRRWMIASIMFYFLAVFSKTIAMTLPVILLILDAYPLRRVASGARKLLLEKIPFIALAVLAAGMALYGQRQIMAPMDALPLARRIGVAMYGLCFYLWKTISPQPIWPLYEIPVAMSLLTPVVIASGLTVIGLTASLWIARRRWPAGLAIWASYVVLLLPVSGLSQAGPQLVASRYSYLPALVLSLLPGAFAVWLYAKYRSGGIDRLIGRALGLAAVLFLIGLGALTWKQSRIWRNSGTLWTYALIGEPHSSIAHNNLGMFLIERGDMPAAERHIRTALALNPGNRQAVRNLGALALLGALDEAARKDAGLRLVQQGDMDQAAGIFRSDIAANPRNATAHNNLGVIYYQKGDYREAIASFEAALAIDSGFEEARSNLLAARLKL